MIICDVIEQFAFFGLWFNKFMIKSFLFPRLNQCLLLTTNYLYTLTVIRYSIPYVAILLYPDKKFYDQAHINTSRIQCMTMHALKHQFFLD